MNVLEVLRSDMGFAGRRAWQADENVTDACLDILDEFIAGREVVEVFFCPPDEDTKRRYSLWHDDDTDGQPERHKRTTIIVPRDPEPRITDHTLTERMAVLEDEVKHRCGCLGRRVYSVERKLGVVIGGIPVSKPLLEAAEEALMLMREMQAGRRRGNWAAFDGALDALSAAIKEERER